MKGRRSEGELAVGEQGRVAGGGDTPAVVVWEVAGERVVTVVVGVMNSWLEEVGGMGLD